MQESQLEAARFKDLLSLLAHDLRNPLAALLTNINFVRASLQKTGTEVDEALGDAVLSCNVLELLIANVDLLGRGASSGIVSTGPTRLRGVVEEAMRRILPQAALSEVELRIAPEGAEIVALSDPEHLARALDNLLSNSIQYAPARTTVTLELAQEGDRAMILVVDCGPIVPVELREDAFTAAGQSKAKTRFEARYGRGLGLFCAAQAARLAGAEIEALGRRNLAVFRLSLPLLPRP